MVQSGPVSLKGISRPEMQRILRGAAVGRLRAAMEDDARSVHSGCIAATHRVPMRVLIRPLPPVLDELKVQSLIRTLQVRRRGGGGPFPRPPTPALQGGLKGRSGRASASLLARSSRSFRGIAARGRAGVDFKGQRRFGGGWPAPALEQLTVENRRI